MVEIFYKVKRNKIILATLICALLIAVSIVFTLQAYWSSAAAAKTTLENYLALRTELIRDTYYLEVGVYNFSADELITDSQKSTTLRILNEMFLEVKKHEVRLANIDCDKLSPNSYSYECASLKLVLPKAIEEIPTLSQEFEKIEITNGAISPRNLNTATLDASLRLNENVQKLKNILGMTPTFKQAESIF
jgi:hypothetical protein